MANRFKILNQLVSAVTLQLGQWGRSPSTSLIQQNNPETLGIEKTPVVIFTTAARPAMNDNHRNSVRIAGFLEVQLMGMIHRQSVAGVRLDFRIEGQHEKLRFGDNGSLAETGEKNTGARKTGGSVYRLTTISRPLRDYFLLARLRSFSVRSFLRRRIDLGVTSTSSSSSINSSACSRVNLMGGTRPITSSLPEARMLSSFLPLVGLTTRSLSRLWIPHSWPS